MQYQLVDDGNPYANTRYKAIQANEITTDITDNEGFTKIFYSDKPENIIIHVLKD